MSIPYTTWDSNVQSSGHKTVYLDPASPPNLEPWADYEQFIEVILGAFLKVKALGLAPNPIDYIPF